jgi:hypothetical protein
MVSWRRFARVAAALLAAGALSGASSAPSSANHTIGHWVWSGGLWPTGGGNGKCIWYVAKSACPGWNYWYAIYTLQGNGPDGGSVLTGFENDERIRGSTCTPDRASRSIRPSSGWADI